MSKIIGSFYLIQNETGNLMGEFTNNASRTVSVESACLKEAGVMAYEGRYLSSWLEEGIPHTAELVIDMANSESDARYQLVWNDLYAGPLYKAEAILAEGFLVGHFEKLV